MVLLLIIIAVSFSIYRDINPKEVIQKYSTYTEGLYGSVQKLNPVYTDFNIVDQDISRLLFCGLSSFDTETGQVKENIATHTLDSGQTIYTFKIKDNIKWHDGTDVTADDIIFTYVDVIQDENFQNRILKNTFKDVEIKKIDKKTVEFILKSPNSFFFTSTIVGLLPSHILKDVEVKDLPLHKFNNKPIGCGPFQFDSISTKNNITQIKLKKFDDYHDSTGEITQVIFNIYNDFSDMINGIDNVYGMARLPIYLKEKVEEDRFTLNEYTLPQYTALFMNTDSKFLKKNKARLGISKAIQKQKIVENIGYKKVIDTPLLELNQDDWINKSNIDEAMGALFDSGWKLDKEKGFRVNSDGEIFHLKLLSRLYDENSKAQEVTSKVLAQVKEQLEGVGVKIKIIRMPLAELEDAIMKRDYDLLLYGQNLGYNLDIYSFWHSSQTENGLNLSNYANPSADILIERIRYDFDPDGKKQKLERLANVLVEDVPAVFLYTPSYYFIVDNHFSGTNIKYMATPTDRLNNLQNWTIKK